MRAYELKKSESIICTDSKRVLEFARRLQAMGSTDCEREDKAKRKERIKHAILRGETLPFRWAFGNVLSTGVQKRVNGQHSTEVFLELTAEEWAKVPFPIIIHWDEYDCLTPIALATLFESMDASWSARNNTDVMSVHLGVHEEFRHIDSTVGVKMTNGLLWYEEKILHLPKRGDTRFQIVHQNHSLGAFLKWGGSFLQKQKTSELLYPFTVAAIYHTVRDVNPVDDPGPHSFWKDVAGGKARLESDSAEYKLAEYLEAIGDKEYEWPRTISRYFAKSAKHPSAMDTFGTCLHAFYASREGKRIGEVFASAKNKDADEVIAAYGAGSGTKLVAV